MSPLERKPGCLPGAQSPTILCSGLIHLQPGDATSPKIATPTPSGNENRRKSSGPNRNALSAIRRKTRLPSAQVPCPCPMSRRLPTDRRASENRAARASGTPQTDASGYRLPGACGMLLASGPSTEHMAAGSIRESASVTCPPRLFQFQGSRELKPRETASALRRGAPGS